MISEGPGRDDRLAIAALDVAAELEALCASAGVEDGPVTRWICGEGPDGGAALRVDCTWRSVSGGAPTLRGAVVTLGPWSRRYEWSEGDEADDAEDRTRELLDLVGAVIFGELVVEEVRVSGACAWVMKVADGQGQWRRCAHGHEGWRGMALGVVGVRWPGSRRCTWRVERARPTGADARWRRVETALPWAPWAGAAGFVGGDAEAAPQEIPVDGELDLHRFSPKDVKRLLLAYIDECLAREITELRVVHGKGKGHMRRTVHAILDSHPAVEGYRLAGHGRGSWGATLVELKSPPRR